MYVAVLERGNYIKLKYVTGFCTLPLWISIALAGPDNRGLLHACHLPNFSQEVLCGSHTVFEDRVKATGRTIQINFAVIPAISEVSESDPLVILPGGPGQAAMEMGPLVNLAFREINQNRDVVLIDQRGTGSSHPLQCELPAPIAGEFQVGYTHEEVRNFLRKCLETLDTDATLYTQDLANQDMHEVLITLGYNPVNIYGVSWGTRAAQIYSEQFPDHVRSMILDGNVPFENKIPLFASEDAERSLQLTFASCKTDPDCHAAFPNLENNLVKAIAVLGEKGKQITMNDPTSAQKTTFTVTKNQFVTTLREILYVPEFVRLLPIILNQASTGNYKAIAGVSSFFSSQLQGTVALGASLSILCSEDLSRITDRETTAMSQSGFVGSAMIDAYRNQCSVWPTASVPIAYSEFEPLNIPVLLLSGQVDPVTPPRWGDIMAKRYTNSLHLVASNTGHNVAPVPCTDKLMAKFVNSASLSTLDGTCLSEVQRRSFFTSPSGPGRSSTDDSR